MVTRLMKFISAVALVALLPMLWKFPMGIATMAVAFLVWAGAVVVFVQAVATRRYMWAAGFTLIALAFNPISPVVISRATFVAIDVCSMAAFVSSLYFMKRTPRLSLASITDVTARSESL